MGKENGNLIQIELPEAFGSGAFVWRVARIKVKDVMAFHSIQPESQDFEGVRAATLKKYEWAARYFPEWGGVLDFETGETLPNPASDPLVFEELDAPCWNWLATKGINYVPN